jgi:hypothetical protein
MVSEEVMNGILTRRSRAHQPEGIGHRHVLHRGLVVGQAQAGS